MTETENTTAAETQQQEVVFQSKASNYRLVMVPQRRRQIGESNESEIVGGKAIQFYDGVYKTSDPEEIDFLRNYASNGTFYFEVGSDNDHPDDAAGLLKEVIQKSAEGDFDRIAEILVAERHNLSRPAVITACEAALIAYEQALPDKPATPLHEVQRVRVGPTAGETPGVSPDPVEGTPLVDSSTLTPPPGAPAIPTEETSVPVGQVPAETASADPQAGEAAETPSSTMPSAEGPQVGGDGSLQGDASVTPTAEPVGSPTSEEVPADTPGDHPAAGGDGAEPGAPAAPPQGETPSASETEGQGQTPPDPETV